MDKILVPLSTIENQEKSYLFEIDDKFLGDNLLFPLKKCQITVNCVASRSNSTILINAFISGEIETICARCNSDLKLYLLRKVVIVGKFDKESNSDKEEKSHEIAYIKPSDKYINITEIIRDHILLAWYNQRTHSEGQCPQDFENLLKKYTYNHSLNNNFI